MNEPTTRTIEEAYSSATNAQSLALTLADGPRCSADLLIASGWSPSRIGSALLRLHSEYDGTPKPRKMADAAIEAYAAAKDAVKGQTASHKQNLVAAHQDAEAWHVHELKLMLGRLKSLPDVREQLTIMAHQFGMEHPQEVAVGVLAWWVDSVCGMCHGQQRQQIKDAPTQAGAVCPACRGSGRRKLPYGEAGRKIEGFIEDCLYRARQSIGKRLHCR